MSNAASTEPNQASAWGACRIVALMVAFSFMSWFNRVSMAVAYDTKIGPDYGISEEAIGTVFSAFFLSYLLFMTPGGWFIDRFGAKPPCSSWGWVPVCLGHSQVCRISLVADYWSPGDGLAGDSFCHGFGQRHCIRQPHEWFRAGFQRRSGLSSTA